MHFDPLVILKGLIRLGQVGREKRVHQLVGHARRCVELGDRPHHAGQPSRLLGKLASGAFDRRLGGLHGSGGQLPHPLLKRDAVIANERDAMVARQGQHDHGARMPHDFPRDFIPTRQRRRDLLKIKAAAVMNQSSLDRRAHWCDDRCVSAKRRKPGAGGRKTFDPSRMRAAASLFEQDQGVPPPPSEPAAPAAAPAELRYTVAQLAAMIDNALKTGLPARLSVVGEVSGFKEQTHWYFRLKDSAAVIECVMFSSAVRKHTYIPRDGEEIVARGRVEHFARQGRTQLYVDRVEPIGAGALELKFRELCNDLRALGWFDPAAKKPLPRFPRRVAVVTSKTGAALHDVLDTFQRRAPFIPLLLVDVRVQGDRAAADIANAIAHLNKLRERLQLDAILLTRGGGSIEDLWAFNERVVAEAIHRSALPVVAAIGHETDTTIAELVADERAATPTQAAMRLSPDRHALQEQADQLAARLRFSTARFLSHEQQRLRAVARHPFLTDPRSLMREHARRLSRLHERMTHCMIARAHREQAKLADRAALLAQRRPEALLARRDARVHEADRRLNDSVRRLLERRRYEIEQCRRTLEATGPMNVLRRGYSVTLDANGQLVRSASDVSPGDVIQTRLSDGVVHSTVTQSADQAPTVDDPDPSR